MDRKDFLKTVGQVGIISGAVAALGGQCTCFAAATEAPATKSTPCEEKQEWIEGWTKRFFDNLDSELDQTTRIKLLVANGRACYRHSREGRTATPISINKLVDKLQKYEGKENVRLEDNIVYFNYQTPDGKCLCPLVEAGPKELSHTYCNCSVGYVTEMFSQAIGKPVAVELLESLRRGGTGCKFKVTPA